jgi:hypothetical protein
VAPTAAQVAAVRAALARRVMGGAVTVLRAGTGVTLYRRAARRTVTIDGPRRTKVVAAVCHAPSCRVTIRSELRLKTRRGGVTRTRRIVLPTSRRVLSNGAAKAFGVALTAAQRRAVRAARSTILRVSYAFSTGGATTRGTWQSPLRVR